MKYTLLYTMIMLIIILVLVSIMAPRLKEHFSQSEEEVPFKSINICGRNIVFPYFSRNKFTASQRSIYDPSYDKTNPIGKCRKDFTNGVVNESHSIVHENSLFYVLKHSCLAFRIKNFSVKENGKIVDITFNAIEKTDVQNLVNLILLNPIYIEFNLNSDFSSVGYRISVDSRGKPLIFSNAEGIKSYTDEYMISFVSVNDNTKGACDNAFNYRELSSDQTLVKEDDFQKIIKFNQSVLNMKVYHLDPLTNSFQYIGRSLIPDNKSSGAVTFFEKDYQKYYNTDNATQKYEFMNNIALMYSNNVYPIFTFSFNVQIEKGKFIEKLMIAKIYMDNTIGKYSQFCSDIRDKIEGAQNNNIMSVAIESIDDYFYKMHFFTGAGNDCNFNENSKLTIKLPYLSVNSYTNLSVTISPNEKVVLAYWNDINAKDVTTKMVFGKKNMCNDTADYDVCKVTSRQDPEIKNNFYDLFVKNSSGSRVSLENIIMNFDTRFVNNVKSCDLGYINLFKKIQNQ